MSAAFVTEYGKDGMSDYGINREWSARTLYA